MFKGLIGDLKCWEEKTVFEDMRETDLYLTAIGGEGIGNIKWQVEE
jgi:hypothetical protein